ncbi:MAG: DUF115 domain-containing protein [Thaumarchaeota archaeon]|jgi:uncharacterized Rossmann fold enzyme|nr:DUF115 domain-containing protein [Candidatus Geocrenenecus arthurdayi]MCL7390621.1 DUF115 domain-containing protein [Candidatus Geocrenenecus arthurdayi]MCL7395874.1 DUF115 domain-containing protein [Candidatus Geocrenenecus arthurdayi]MCL7403328.1 DUF115 domain-containing protein [Candidatus Geocrenenecus arthurdayi]
MDWREWKPLYLEIVKEMGYSIEQDFSSAQLLNKLLSGRAITLDELRKKVCDRTTAVVFGAGPSLTLDISNFIDSKLLNDVVVIVADGASKAFLERGLRVDIVVTDLDGGDEVLIEASKNCLAMVVHSHGDNIDRIERLVPLLHKKILGTTQCKPFGFLYNFGGFTDGDRAVFLADTLGFEKIILAGMDFGEEVGEYSKNTKETDNEWLKAKKKKLSLGKKLLELYASKSSRKLYNATSRGEEIRGFIKASFKEIAQMLG